MRVLTGILRALVKLLLFALFAWLFVKPFALLAASFFTSDSFGLIRTTSEFMGALFRTVFLYLGLGLLLTITHKLRFSRFAQVIVGFAATGLLCWIILKAAGIVILAIAKVLSAIAAVIMAIFVVAIVGVIVCKYNPGTLLAFWLIFGDKDEEDS